MSRSKSAALSNKRSIALEQKESQNCEDWLEKSYKLNRTKKVTRTNKVFDYPSSCQWNPKDKFKNASGLFLGKVQKAQAHVYGRLRKELQEKVIMNSRLIKETEEFDIYEFKNTDKDELLREMMKWTNLFEIISPASLLDYYIDSLEQTLALQKKRKLNIA